MSSGDARLELTGLRVVFGSNVALDDVDLVINPGEVHGLLGHNGSGKSTLIKTLAGVNVPDSGTLRINGEELSLPIPPHVARAHGLGFVHQGLGLAPNLTVVENIAVGKFHTNRIGHINWGRQAKAVAHQLEKYGMSIPLSTHVGDLSPVEQAVVAIVRALGSVEGVEGHRTVVLDEPTVYLPREQVNLLFDVVRQLAAQGDSVIFVSHRIDEVLALTDRISVLREGKLVATRDTVGLDERAVVRLIVGRDMAAADPAPSGRRARAEDRDVVLGVAQASSDAFAPVDIDFARGEIVGVTGLAGSGFAELPYVLAGVIPGQGRIHFGEIERDVATMTPGRAASMGVVLIPADRPHLAVVSAMSITENVSVPHLRRFFRNGHLSPQAEKRFVEEAITRMSTRFGRVSDPMSTLSGGNQQKCVLAKWLVDSPKLALMHEPTQGVDVGGRFDIYAQLRTAAERGTSFLIASESSEELAEVCDRVLIFRDGEIVTELTGDDVHKHAIIDAAHTDSSARQADLRTAVAS